jgi:flavin-dependent dehydrogenase
MNPNTDVAVVGGGPCGSFAALTAAKLGANVTVFEEHEEIGVPSHCAGHFSSEAYGN